MRGMLFSQMEPPQGMEEEFHRWYDEEHIPARLAVSGFERADRFEAIEGEPRYLAVYYLSDMAALDSDEYQAVKQQPSDRTRHMLASVKGFTRYTCDEITDSGEVPGEPSFLTVVAFHVPESRVEQFDDWYDSEHSPMLLQAPDWLRVRRYGVIDAEGQNWTRLALHELASQEVMDSPERAAARKGPKREALASEEWFERSGRWFYRRIRSFTA